MSRRFLKKNTQQTGITILNYYTQITCLTAILQTLQINIKLYSLVQQSQEF